MGGWVDGWMDGWMDDGWLAPDKCAGTSTQKLQLSAALPTCLLAFYFKIKELRIIIAVTSGMRSLDLASLKPWYACEVQTDL